MSAPTSRVSAPATAEAAPPPDRPRRLRLWLAVTLGCWLTAMLVGVATASLLKRDLPQIQSLQDYAPPVLTRVYATDGTLLRQFGEQRRLVIPFDRIPETFKQALLSIEDADFYRHPGVDLSAILRAVWRDLVEGRRAQGASTITQQLARDLRLPTVFGEGVLTTEKTVTRKIQEWILALQIEKTYTKDEILELYCNQIYYGHGFYGVEAASRFYFGKPAAALNLEQAALLAGVVQRPESYSPFRHPERARGRRNVVLRRMVAENYLTAAQADAASQRPLAVARPISSTRQLGPYFLEEVRKDLARRYGDQAASNDGLEIRTTLSPQLQDLAETALRRQLRRVDRMRGFRPIDENVVTLGLEPESWDGLDPDAPLVAGDVIRGVVLEVAPGQARIRLAGDRSGVLGPEGVAWTGKSDLTLLLERGDVSVFEITGSLDTDPLVLRLDQAPEVEGAVVVLDPRSGAVRALVGGYDFERSEYNRAVQARRPVGSAFKPVVYAAALEQGITPSDLLYDDPTIFVNPRTGDLYQPENYERDYWGLITLRAALEHSRNIASVKLINTIGFRPVFDVARRLGITTALRPYPSLALGAVEISLMEMTSAYGAFANGGLHVEGHLIESITDRSGREQFRVDPASSQAMDPEIAYVLTQMLQGVIRRGSGKSVSDFPAPVAGKTGTTDGHSDAWFIGYTSSLVCGVWVGLDRVESIGRGQSGARVALPVWNEIMRAALELEPAGEFSRPGPVVQVAVDAQTGRRAAVETGCSRVILESYVQGTAPDARCGAVPHYRQALPYFLQLQPIGDDLRLHIDDGALDELIASESAFVSYLPISGNLSVTYGDQAVTVGVRRLDGWRQRLFGFGRRDDSDRVALVPRGPLLERAPAPLPEELPDPPDGVTPLAERRGLDGRQPRLVLVDPDR